MNILVIGGTGIISSDVCKECEKQGIDLTVVNRGKRGSIVAAKQIIADVRNEKLGSLQKKIGNEIYDVVVDFLSYTEEQLKKTVNIAKCKQYVFVSTATVYEENPSHIYTEESPKGNQGWSYCKNKYNCERAIMTIAKERGFFYTIIRPYVTYSEKRFPYQICPGEYYTIIYRIKNQLPLPICGLDSVTTVTSSKDFAKRFVGLLGNEKAYNKDFHITADVQIEWKEIAEVMAEKYCVQCEFIDFSREFLENCSSGIIDIPEILFDKSRNMRFNNTKVKAAVPQFTGDSSFKDCVDTVFNFFENKNNQQINYLWMGCLDRFIEEYSGKVIGKEEYVFPSNKAQLMYTIGRNKMLSAIYEGLKKIKHIK